VTLSRTARILIALLLVAAAAFVWINFFSSAPDAPPASPAVQAPAPSPDASGAVDGAVDGAADAGAPSVAVPGAAPTVVAPSDGTVVGREVEVAELPFLIDQPPAVELPEDGNGNGEAGIERPGGDARASVNPFSPIVAPASASAGPAPATTPPEVEVVDVPDAPEVQDVAAQAPVPPAPAPRALAPAGAPAATLPRTVANGTLPVVPSVLRDTRAEPLAPTPIDLPQRTAVREPAGPVGAPPLPTLSGSPVGPASAEPTPLAAGAVPASGTPDQPLVAGADGLARYLRDRNVVFTGSVVGSVGVGVFRVAGTTAPIVLALGQTLPDTEIVLTDLRGQTAEFTLGDTTHVLSLDLRR
jgi:hypothetical protein